MKKFKRSDLLGKMSEKTNENMPIEPFEWTSHRAQEKPLMTVLAVGVIIISAICVSIWWDSFWAGIFVVVFMFLGLSNFFLPVHYKINDEGISEEFLGRSRFARWTYFKRIVSIERDILLSPYSKRNFMDRFRAWNIRTPNEQIAKIIKNIFERKCQ